MKLVAGRLQGLLLLHLYGSTAVFTETLAVSVAYVAPMTPKS
jgi:hypothetical protein